MVLPAPAPAPCTLPTASQAAPLGAVLCWSTGPDTWRCGPGADAGAAVGYLVRVDRMRRLGVHLARLTRREAAAVRCLQAQGVEVK